MASKQSKRIRCTDCTELFTKDRLVDGKCSVCRSIVEVTDPITGEKYFMRPDTAWSSELKAEHGIL